MATAKAPCRFFGKGTCTYGDHCRFAHVGASASPGGEWSESEDEDEVSARPEHEWSVGPYMERANRLAVVSKGGSKAFIAVSATKPEVAVCCASGFTENVVFFDDGTPFERGFVNFHDSVSFSKLDTLSLPAKGGPLTFDPETGGLLVVLAEAGEIALYEREKTAKADWVSRGTIKLSEMVSEAVESISVSHHPLASGIILKLDEIMARDRGLPRFMLHTTNGVVQLPDTLQTFEHIMATVDRSALLVSTHQQLFRKFSDNALEEIDFTLAAQDVPTTETIIPAAGLSDQVVTCGWNAATTTATIFVSSASEPARTTFTVLKGIPDSVLGIEAFLVGCGDQAFLLGRDYESDESILFAVDAGWRYMPAPIERVISLVEKARAEQSQAKQSLRLAEDQPEHRSAARPAEPSSQNGPKARSRQAQTRHNAFLDLDDDFDADNDLSSDGGDRTQDSGASAEQRRHGSTPNKRGNMSTARGDLSEAVVEQEDPVALSKRYCARGVRESREKKWSAALDSFTKACDHQPTSSKMHAMRGDALMEMGKFEAAEAAYTTAIHCGDFDCFDKVLIGLGKANLRLGRIEVAVDKFREANGVNPLSFETCKKESREAEALLALLRNGREASAEGRYQDALAAFEDAAKRAPACVEAVENAKLAREQLVASRTKQFKEPLERFLLSEAGPSDDILAIATVTDAVRAVEALATLDPSIYFTAAAVHLRAGHMQEALEFFNLGKSKAKRSERPNRWASVFEDVRAAQSLRREIERIVQRSSFMSRDTHDNFVAAMSRIPAQFRQFHIKEYTSLYKTLVQNNLLGEAVPILLLAIPDLSSGSLDTMLELAACFSRIGDPYKASSVLAIVSDGLEAQHIGEATTKNFLSMLAGALQAIKAHSDMVPEFPVREYAAILGLTLGSKPTKGQVREATKRMLHTMKERTPAVPLRYDELCALYEVAIVCEAHVWLSNAKVEYKEISYFDWTREVHVWVYKMIFTASILRQPWYEHVTVDFIDTIKVTEVSVAEGPDKMMETLKWAMDAEQRELVGNSKFEVAARLIRASWATSSSDPGQEPGSPGHKVREASAVNLAVGGSTTKATADDDGENSS